MQNSEVNRAALKYSCCSSRAGRDKCQRMAALLIWVMCPTPMSRACVRWQSFIIIIYLFLYFTSYLLNNVGHSTAGCWKVTSQFKDWIISVVRWLFFAIKSLVLDIANVSFVGEGAIRSVKYFEMIITFTEVKDLFKIYIYITHDSKNRN